MFYLCSERFKIRHLTDDNNNNDIKQLYEICIYVTMYQKLVHISYDCIRHEYLP